MRRITLLFFIMILQVDSRQQSGKHKLKHDYFESLGIKLVVSKMLVGDYCIPSNGSVVVDTKKDMTELYGDIIQQHERFRNECILAQEAGIKLYILVENTNSIETLKDIGTDKWKNPLWFKYYKYKKGKPPVKNITLMKMLYTMQEKYGVEFVFCSPEDAGKKVLELLNMRDFQ